MKPKKHTLKLQLKKETVSDLNGNEMGNAKGGASGYTLCYTYCPTLPTYCPCHTQNATDCVSCVPCVSVQTGCYPVCTVPACPA